MQNSTRNILVTGYWEPTNEMLRQFSPDPEKNNGFWNGKNWKGLGFDIYGYFPEFREIGNDLRGTGELTVDYRRTLTFIEKYTALLKPCAIVTFSLGESTKPWEIEKVQFNRSQWQTTYQLSRWTPPDPIPPDDTIPPDAPRESTLPMVKIMDAVNAVDIPVRALIDDNGVGGFISEYIAYLGVWYQSRHAPPNGRDRCFAAGHIHVGKTLDVGNASAAAEITIEEVIKYISPQLRSFVCEGYDDFSINPEDVRIENPQRVFTKIDSRQNNGANVLATYSGTAVFAQRGKKKWSRGSLLFRVPTFGDVWASRDLPAPSKSIYMDQSATKVSLASIFNEKHAIGAGWAVDSSQAQIIMSNDETPEPFLAIGACVAVADTDGILYRVSYTVTVAGQTKDSVFEVPPSHITYPSLTKLVRKVSGALRKLYDSVVDLFIRKDR